MAAGRIVRGREVRWGRKKCCTVASRQSLAEEQAGG
jgi:hypothetical protein